LHKNDDNMESDDKENNVTDMWKEKLIHKVATTSFNTCLKWAEWNKVPLHQNIFYFIT
jgi:hypothetical protein